MTFTLTATNNGPGDTTGVVIVDALPAGFEFVFADPECVHLAGTVTCTIGALASGASDTVEVVARATVAAAGATHTNTAATSSDLPDPEPANNAAGADVTSPRRPTSASTKTANHDPTGVDQVVTYTLTVSNAGPNDATGVEIQDALALGVIFVSAPGCSFDATTRIVLCTVGDIANGASRTVTITVRPGSDLALSTLTNTATVTGDQTTPMAATTSSPRSSPSSDRSISR